MYRKLVINHSDTSRIQISQVLLNQTMLTSGTAGGGWAVATTTTKVKTTLGSQIAVDYQTASLGVLDNITITTTAGAQATGTFCLYLLTLNFNATVVSAFKGPDLLTDPGFDPSQGPLCPASQAPVALIKVQNASGAGFTIGTTAFTAAGITATFKDMVQVPSFAFGPSALGSIGNDIRSVPGFGSYRMQALGFSGKNANTGNVFWGDLNVAADGSRGNLAPKVNPVDWLAQSAQLRANSDVGSFDSRDFFVIASAASNVTFVDVIGGN